jgi:hypothetical protein
MIQIYAFLVTQLDNVSQLIITNNKLINLIMVICSDESYGRLHSLFIDKIL